MNSESGNKFRPWTGPGNLREALFIAVAALFIVGISASNINARSIKHAIWPPKKEEIPTFLKTLGSRNNEKRFDAARRLAMVDHEPGVLEGLADGLKSDNQNLVEGSATAIGMIDPLPKEMVPGLIAALDTAKGRVRSAIAETIGKFGPDALESVSALIKALGDNDGWVRMQSAGALGEIGPGAFDAVPALSKLLYDKERFVAQTAAETLAVFGPAAVSALPALVETLGDTWAPNTPTKHIPKGVFESIGPECIPFLQEAIRSGDQRKRMLASEALIQFNKAAAQALVEVVNEEEGEARQYAAQGLAEIDVEGDEAVKALISALGDSNPDARMEAIRALGSMGPEAGEAIPKLIEVEYTDNKLKHYAKEAIELIGIRSTENIDGLIELLKHSNEDVRIGGAEALGFLGDRATDAIPALKALVQNDNHEVQREVLKALAKILPADEGVAYFIGLLKDKSNTIVVGAVEGLASYAPESDDALAAVIRMLGHQQSNVQDAARKALVELGDAAITSLIKGVKDSDKAVRINAIKAIGDLGESAESAVPDLIKALDDEECEVRLAVISSLIKIGPGAADALPKLRELAENDPYVNVNTMKYPVRNAARDAIVKIEGAGASG